MILMSPVDDHEQELPVTTTYDPGPRPAVAEQWTERSRSVPHPWARQAADAAEERRAERLRQRQREQVPTPR